MSEQRQRLLSINRPVTAPSGGRPGALELLRSSLMRRYSNRLVYVAARKPHVPIIPHKIVRLTNLFESDDGDLLRRDLPASFRKPLRSVGLGRLFLSGDSPSGRPILAAEIKHHPVLHKEYATIINKLGKHGISSTMYQERMIHTIGIAEIEIPKGETAASLLNHANNVLLPLMHLDPVTVVTQPVKNDLG